MCGRFVSAGDAAVIAGYFDALPPTQVLTPSYNVAPTNDVYAVVTDRDRTRRMDTFRWGLVPAWAKDIRIGSKLINARAETLADKPAFKALFRSRRCIIPMDGFYEWMPLPAGAPTDGAGRRAARPAKQPVYISRGDGQPLAVAGLWSAWRDPAIDRPDRWLHSCTVITTAANTAVVPIHDRMPAILEAHAWDRWLDADTSDLHELGALLRPAPLDLLTIRPVSPDVNRVTNKGPELLRPYVPAQPAERLIPATSPLK